MLCKIFMVFITNVETISKTTQVCYSSGTTFSSRSNKLNIYGNLYYCKNHYYLICHLQKQSSEDVLKKTNKKNRKRYLEKNIQENASAVVFLQSGYRLPTAAISSREDSDNCIKLCNCFCSICIDKKL